MRTQKVLAPLPLAVAALVCAMAGNPLYAAPAKPNTPAAAKNAATVHRIVLKTGIAEGKMVFLDAQGKANPTLRAKVGDTVEIEISSGEGAQHDIVIPELKVASAKFVGQSGPTRGRF